MCSQGVERSGGKVLQADVLPSYCVPERAWGPCKVSDAGKIEDGQCAVATVEAGVSVHPLGSVTPASRPTLPYTKTQLLSKLLLFWPDSCGVI